MLITSKLAITKHKHWVFKAVVIKVTLFYSEQAAAMPTGGLGKAGFARGGGGRGGEKTTCP